MFSDPIVSKSLPTNHAEMTDRPERSNNLTVSRKRHAKCEMDGSDMLNLFYFCHWTLMKNFTPISWPDPTMSSLGCDTDDEAQSIEALERISGNRFLVHARYWRPPSSLIKPSQESPSSGSKLPILICMSASIPSKDQGSLGRLRISARASDGTVGAFFGRVHAGPRVSGEGCIVHLSVNLEKVAFTSH
jgi:hypothetical protein